MARRKTRRSVSARPRRPPRRRARRTPTTELARTYLDRFEERDQRAPTPPSPALEGLVVPGERSPAFAGLAAQQPPVPADRFAELFRGGGQFTPSLTQRILASFGEPLFRVKETPGVPEGGFGGIFREAGQEVASSLVTALGRTAVLGGLFGERVQQAPLPTLGNIGSRISRRGGPEQLGARRLFTTVSALYRGVRPPMIGFDAQEFLGLTDEEIEGIGYTKVPGGWVRRELWDQPLNNVYGSGTAAQPQTINVNYGGYGGGGGTRQQSSYLVNWRI